MMRSGGQGLRLVSLGIFLWVLYGSAASADVFYGKKDGLKEMFPHADQIEAKRFFLSPAQATEVAQKSGAKMEDRLVTIYVASKKGEILGYGFIETHLVRTMPETILVRISPDGAVERLLLLAFYEPRDYFPSVSWLAQFQGEELDSDLRVRRDIQGIGGATLTAHALTQGVRKSLALLQIVTAEPGEKD